MFFLSVFIGIFSKAQRNEKKKRNFNTGFGSIQTQPGSRSATLIHYYHSLPLPSRIIFLFIIFTLLKRYNYTVFIICPYSILAPFCDHSRAKFIRIITHPFFKNSLYLASIIFRFITGIRFTVCPKRLFQKFKRLAKRFMKRPWPGLHYQHFVITTPWCTHLPLPPPPSPQENLQYLIKSKNMLLKSHMLRNSVAF